jgi:putative transposase
MQWLYEAKKRYGLMVLNYAVTSNHTHLITYGKDDEKTIPKSIQLIAGRTGQEYNRRKKRKGAFWEDRYHATAVETGEHRLRCIVYIDMNNEKIDSDSGNLWDWKINDDISDG